MFKVGDRVVLLKTITFAPAHRAYNKHLAGMIGVVSGVTWDWRVSVRFTNCSCGCPLSGSCDIFPPGEDWLMPAEGDQIKISESSVGCKCPSFELTHFGHDLHCIERKR